jgi:hypothetical protein
VRRAVRRGIVAAAVVAMTLMAVAPAAHAGEVEDAHARRLLVLSLPGVSYADLDLDQLPNIKGLLDDSAIANLSARGVLRQPTLGDAYVTIGAGARARGRIDEGQCLNANEVFEGGSAGDALARRAGIAPDSIEPTAVVCLAAPAIADRNDGGLFGAEAGLLGDELEQAGFGRAVIGNADHATPIDPSGLHRSVGLALADRNGVVPSGSVTAELVALDPSAPYGVHAANDVYLQRFRENWNDQSVVLVEASDLVRFDSYRAFVADDAELALKHQLLRNFDALVGELLTQVDPERDAVMIVGPTHLAGDRHLMMATLRAPGVEPGYLTSSFTGRDDVVSIVDVGPTILSVVGIEPPDAMEGRTVEVHPSDASTADRISRLVKVDDAANFREQLRAGVTAFAITIQFVVLGLALLALLFFPRARGAVGFLALALIAFLPATYLARLFPFYDWGIGPYWVFVLGTAFATAVIAWFATSRRTNTALVVVLSVMIAVLVADLLTGSNLQYNSVFGVSALLGGRFSGLPNLGYAQLSAGSLLLAGLLLKPTASTRLRVLTAVLLLGAIAIDGAPFWGSDVGGVLSMVPAYLFFFYLLFGRRFRWRSALIGALATAALLGVFAAIDMARSESTTHLGRLVNAPESGGGNSISHVIHRKLDMMLRTLTSGWMYTLPIALVLIVCVVLATPGRLEGLYARAPMLRPASYALAVLAILGFALNDSGIAIPGMMVVVLAPSVVFLASRTEVLAPIIVLRRRPEPVVEEPIRV